MRVSSRDDRQSVESQRHALLQAGVDERQLFEDRVSGSVAHRPGLTACLAALTDRDTLLVWKIDRLGRSLAHMIDIVSGLKARGVGFRSLTDPIDTTTPQGEFLLAIFGALAQYERAMAIERVNAGLAVARSKGRFPGRPKKIDDETMQSIVQALNAGATRQHVYTTFKVSRTTLNDSLKRVGWREPGDQVNLPGSPSSNPTAERASQ